MENHPIPQDVTGFQFKLIGEMTIKQFFYVALGAVLAWIALSVPILFIIKFIIALLLFVIGFSLAFIPAGGRPMDLMILFFLKALFNPNQYVYKKSQGGLQEAPIGKKSSHQEPSPPPPLPIQQELQSLMAEKQRLEEELKKLQSQIAPVVSKPQPAPSTIPASLPSKPIIIQSRETQAANFITGSVKDSSGNVLPNILVEVKDKDSNPVRAFKTNPLGQFSSATPLLNGTYTVEIEDPRGHHRFSSLQITAEGKALAPLVISAIDERGELRKTLFGNA